MNAKAATRRGAVWDCECHPVKAVRETPRRSAPKAVQDRAPAFPLRSTFRFGWEMTALIALQIRNTQDGDQQKVHERQNANQNIHVSPMCSPQLIAEAPDLGFAQNPFTYREGAGVYP